MRERNTETLNVQNPISREIEANYGSHHLEWNTHRALDSFDVKAPFYVIFYDF